jgi:hypothetical protein
MNVEAKTAKRRRADKQQEKRSAKDRKRADRKRQNEIAKLAKQLNDYFGGSNVVRG